MKKIRAWFGLTCFVTALLFPAAVAQAKEIPADGNIPLTSEYFPDEWFLKYRAQTYDKDKDGYLSPDEIAEVTTLVCLADLPDFTPIQYFTNLRELELHRNDEVTFRDGVWVGTDIDLTVFPNLEKVQISIDSEKMPAGSKDVQIRVSGLKKLKKLHISDEVSGAECGYDGSNAKIDEIDLRDLPSLEKVFVSDVKGINFDGRNRIRSMYVSNMQHISGERISDLTGLEELTIYAGTADLCRIDVSENRALRKLEIVSHYLEEVSLAGADALEDVSLESCVLKEADISQNPAISSLSLACAQMKDIYVADHPDLFSLSITSDVISGINVRNNQKLQYLYVYADHVDTLDITANRELKGLDIASKGIRKLNLKNNRKLTELSVRCENLVTLDLSANKKLQRIDLSDTPLRSLDLSGQKALTELSVSRDRKLTKLDVSKQPKLYMLKVTGNKKLTKLDLSKNKRLSYVDVSNNALKTLKLGAKAKISYLNCSKNKLTTLNVSQLPYLSDLNCSKNKLTTLDLSKATFLQELVCDKKVKVKGYKGKIKRI